VAEVRGIRLPARGGRVAGSGTQPLADRHHVAATATLILEAIRLVPHDENPQATDAAILDARFDVGRLLSRRVERNPLIDEAKCAASRLEAHGEIELADIVQVRMAADVCCELVADELENPLIVGSDLVFLALPLQESGELLE